LNDYKVLFATGPNITEKAVEKITTWVDGGGYLFASGNAGTRNEFNEPVRGLSEALGVKPGARATVQDGTYRVRGRLNTIPHLDRICINADHDRDLGPGFGIIGLKTDVKATDGAVVAQFADASPAVITHPFGHGQALCVATTPGISYIKDAKFVAAELKEKWPAEHRRFINATAKAAGALPQIELSHAVVEAGVYEGPRGVAIVLANFTYEQIEKLTLALPVRSKVTRIHTADNPGAEIPFVTQAATPAQRAEGFSGVAKFSIPLGLDQIVLIR
jgi:hypothetical protein